MKNRILKYKIDPFYIFTIILFTSFLIRTASPFFKYLNFALLPVHIIISTAFFLHFRPQIDLITYIKKYWTFLLLVLIFIIYFIFTGSGIVLIYNEVYNILFITYITIIFYAFFYNLKVTIFNKALNYLFIVINLLVGFSFLKFFDKYFYNLNLSSFFYDLSAEGSSLVADHNFFALIILLGFFLLMFNLRNNLSRSRIILFNLLYLGYVVTIIMTTSRRAVFIFLLIHLLLYIGAFINIYSFRKIFKNLLLGQGILFIILCFIVSFTFFISSASRISLSNQLGFNNANFKSYFANLTYDYSTLLTNNYNLGFWEKYLWHSETTRLFVENWGKKKHTVLFPLNSKDSILAISEGYKLDSTTNASSWRGHAESYTYLPFFKAKKGERYKIEIYCYLSKEFNAELINLAVHGKKGNKIGIDKPNRKIRNKWQKLDINFIGSGKLVRPKIQFIKRYKNDFSNLDGYIVFAAPLIRDFSTNLPESKIYSIKEWNVKEEKQNNYFEDFLYNFLYKKIETNKNICSNEYKNSLQDLIKLQPSKSKNYHLSQKIINSCNTERVEISDGSSAPQKFEKNVALKDIFYNKVVKKILNRKKHSKSIDEKTIADSNSKEFSYSENALIKVRYEFMSYAWKLFRESNWEEKLFGSGFGYLKKFGAKYNNNPNNPTYPHNPFISHLLFSGIVGLIILLIFLGTIIKEYIKRRKQLWIYFIFFIISFFFAFFSGNTYFSTPILVGLSILPYIYKNTENEKDTDNKPEQFYRK